MSLGVGLLGAGRIGRVHAETLAAMGNARLVALHDPDAAAAGALAKPLGAACRRAEEILADPDIGAIIIATPTETHAPLITAGVAAGKTVFCEKPVAPDLARARACAEALGASAPVMIGFNRRFDPHFAALKARYDQGEIGHATLLAITSFDPAPPPVAYLEGSGGIFRDMAIHDFDLACWIFGARPVAVSATGAARACPEIAALGDLDTAVTTLQFADGRIATIRNSRQAAYGYDQRVELLGSAGLLTVANPPETMLVRADNRGVTAARPQAFFLERYAPAYRAELGAFIDAAISGTQLPVTLADGVVALVIAEAAMEAQRTGSAVPVIYPD